MTKIALLFPGQGSQSEGMLAEMAAHYPQVQQRFEIASEVIGKDLWAIAQHDEKGFLHQTAYTQPILLAANLACYDILRAHSHVVPNFVVGHSLGEYAALCAAGAIEFAEAVELVHTRGKLMQEAVARGEGAMAAILGLSADEVDAICASVEEKVSAANYNSPEQTVIAGSTKGVELAMAEAKARGAKRALLLPVSVPSHCELMRGAAAAFSQYLDRIKWQQPAIPVIYNVDAKTRDTREGIESALGAQLYRPVQWVACMERLYQEGVRVFIEVGPAKVLTGLNKRILPDCATHAFNRPQDIELLNTEIFNTQPGEN